MKYIVVMSETHDNENVESDDFYEEQISRFEITVFASDKREAESIATGNHSNAIVEYVQ